MEICAVYKITNTITGDFYIGSSKNVKQRWAVHKCQSVWKNYPNKQLYQDMRKYGVDKFELQILEEVEEDSLKEAEQQFIEKLKPTYNNYNAKGWNIERQKEYHKKSSKKYDNQLCFYNGQTMTLAALRKRFRRQGIDHSTIEAKKYLKNNTPIEFYDVYP